MKLLSLDDMLAAAQSANVPGVENLIAQAEAVAENVGAALAEHLGVKCRNTEFWDGHLYTSFAAVSPDQECPPEIDNGDPSGEWEVGEDLESQGMSMAG